MKEGVWCHGPAVVVIVAAAAAGIKQCLQTTRETTSHCWLVLFSGSFSGCVPFGVVVRRGKVLSLINPIIIRIGVKGRIGLVLYSVDDIDKT